MLAASEDGDAAPGAPRDVAAMRADTEARTAHLGGEPAPVAAVWDERSARVYVPDGAVGTVVYLHGGGWVTGSLDTVDPVCRLLARAAGARVVSVDYRLAPEHPYPAGLEDAEAATRWVLERWGGEGGVAIAGDSAGGNLATVVARRLGGAIAAQGLIYPVCDAAMDTPSYRACARGLHLDADEMAWYFAQYAGPADDPDVSPLRAPSLAGSPPAHVVLASHDVLRDEGEAYAARLPQATVRVWPGTVHGFVRWPGVVDVAREAIAELGGALGRALRPPLK